MKDNGDTTLWGDWKAQHRLPHAKASFAAGRSGSPGEEEGGKEAAVQEGYPRSGKGSSLN